MLAPGKGLRDLLGVLGPGQGRVPIATSTVAVGSPFPFRATGPGLFRAPSSS